MPVPAQPKIFHITHVNNLPSIVADGRLIADADLIARSAAVATIGMSSIKRRRLSLPVRCHPGDRVGDCVPFYFCPRSIMLYIIHCANHPDLAYRGGQGSIVHLELDLREVAARATMEQRRWAFTLSNAGASYAEFRSRLDQLGDINWDAVDSTDFRSSTVKEGKQAEFLVHGFVPWDLVRRIGVRDQAVAARAQGAISGAVHRPPIDVLPSGTTRWSMIEPATGDILRANAEAIVNTVNCVGFMGRGIAAQFKRAFPENFRAYEAACERGEVQPGRMLVYEVPGSTNPRWIINFPTKRHWSANSKIEDRACTVGQAPRARHALLATVHWLLARERVHSNQLVEAVYAWNARKRQFSARQIELARDVLREKGWAAHLPASA